jgi:hypothetical protein
VIRGAHVLGTSHLSLFALHSWPIVRRQLHQRVAVHCLQDNARSHGASSNFIVCPKLDSFDTFEV